MQNMSNDEFVVVSAPEFKSQTIVSLLRERALQNGSRSAYTFLVDGEAEKIELTYEELDRRSRAIGGWLQLAGAVGERILLLYPHGLEFITAFLGCLYAGAVPVPAYPPRNNRRDPRLESIFNDAQPALALTTKALLPRVEKAASEILSAKKPRIASPDISLRFEEEWREPPIDGESLAMIQYTSGSTSAPKGVMISHRNLICNQQMIQQAFRQTEDSIIVGWLPLFHDMGLVGNVLQPLFLGTKCILLSPTLVVQKPFMWLRTISEYRATTSGGPNFAYENCVRKISPAEREQLDLSSWTTAFNGSEPIFSETMERFADAFAASGFKRESFYPCYGLSEATLLVSAGRNKEQPRVGSGVRSVVNCGYALPSERVIIVDPETLTRAPDEQIGEIWVSGPNVARGYWNQESKTNITFGAYLAESQDGPYLRTGDLGCLKGGELFIAGRIKDLLIIRGRNHYPQDIESTIQKSNPALEPVSCAAFSIEHANEERLVIVQEVRHGIERPDFALEVIREVVAREHEIQPLAIIMVSKGSIPRTSSGKIQRYECRNRYQAGGFAALAEWHEHALLETKAETSFLNSDLTSIDALARETLQSGLKLYLAAKLGIREEQLSVDRSLFQYGVDSLTAIELSHYVESRYGVLLPAVNLLEDVTLVELAQQVIERLKEASALKRPVLKPGANSGNAHPLSYGQRSLWFIHQLAPHSEAYNVSAAVRISSALDSAALRRALQNFVDRHEVLRTTFFSREGEPFQRIHDRSEVTLLETDASAWSRKILDDNLADEAHRPFNLEYGPLLRAHIFSRSPKDHILLVVAHHIVIDLWSMAVLIHELSQFYAAESGAGAASIAPLPVQYADYVYWQRELLASQEGERLWKYWRNQLGDASGVLDLPTDRPRPSIQTYRANSHPVLISGDSTQSLKSLGQEQRVTLFVILQAAFQILLHRYTAQEDIVIGSPTVGRNSAELAKLIGYFVNPVAIRADLSGDPSFIDFLKQARKTALDAIAHQDYPFVQLIERLQLERDPSRSPLFQVTFALEKSPSFGDEGLASRALIEGATLNFGGLSAESIALPRRTSHFDLGLFFVETDEGLKGLIEYNADLFDERRILRMSEHLQTLIQGVISRPHQRISEFELVSERERQQLLVDWNLTEKPRSLSLLLHQLIAEQERLRSDSIAVIYKDEQLSYGELNQRANQLASYLRSLGMGPDSIVGLHLERSAQMIVGIAGILKAGAAYLPLEVGQSIERLGIMLESSAVGVVITEQWLEGQLPAFWGRTVCLDLEWKRIAEEYQDEPLISVEPNNLAYVIYTSGSTGRPKGVMIEHGSIINLMRSLDESISEYDQETGELTVSLNASITFDSSVKQLIQLAKGYRICVTPEKERVDHRSMLEYLGSIEVNVLDCTPSQLKMLMDAGLGTEWKHPKVILVGGEAIDRKSWMRMSETREIKFYNVYGPTECTVDATVCEVNEERQPSIGRPLSNTFIYLLDDRRRLAPTGMAGEIYIGGAGLARGYVGSADSTAEKFTPNEFGIKAGDRLYRTGDIGSRLGDGRIEYLGRNDEQVKVRGYRIELGEIAGILMSHPGVSDAVVTLREDEPEQKRLVGYVVSKQESLLAGKPRRRLPNGLTIVEQTKNETEYLYDEIFKKKIYSKYGIRLPEGGCVFDVGANIGMFTLFVSQNRRDLRVYAFEPIRPIYEALRINTELNGRGRIKLYEIGLGDREQRLSYTYYPGYSVMSGESRYSGATEDIEVIKRYLGHQSESEELLKAAGQILSRRFKEEKHECNVRRLTDIIREEKIEKIDLLKIDVQRAEMNVLRGLKEEDWKVIDQIVMEVHDQKGGESEGRLKQITNLLHVKGYEVAIEQDDLLGGTDRYNVYAKRVGGEYKIEEYEWAEAAVDQASTAIGGEELRRYARALLPEYMVPSAVLVMEKLPLTQSGKVDLKALPRPEDLSGDGESEASAAWSPFEEILIGIWKDVLKVDQASRSADFFEIGGHSLLATQVVSRVREIFGAEIGVMSIFEEPTIEGLSRKIEEAIRGGESASPAPLVRVSRTGRMPLSYAQQRLWFLDQLDPRNPIYNCPATIKLEGSLNLEILERVFNELLRRHEALRTRFDVEGGEPAQIIDQWQPRRLGIVSLMSVSLESREEEAEKIAKAEAETGFDLAHGPLIRIKVLKLGESNHLILLTLHHIVCDGWSIGILIKEFGTLYQAYSAEKESPLEELPIQYVDFAAWQREFLAGNLLESEVSYWNERLKDVVVMELPPDRPRPAAPSHRGGLVRVELKREVGERLRMLSQSEGSTLFMALMAAFKVVLMRHSGVEDVSVGTAIANRTRREVEGLIGFFVNVLVMRTDLSGNPGFRELIGRERVGALGAYAHQEVPFEKLVEELNPERDLSRNPLIHVMMALQNAEREELVIEGLKVSVIEEETGTAKFDLTLSLTEGSAGIAGGLEYSLDLYDEETIERIARHFERVVEAVAGDADQRIGDIELLSAAEKRQVLEEWNETARAFEETQLIHEQIGDQARLRPDSLAISCGQEQISYRELNERANQLAHCLRNAGVGPEVMVGICLERSIEMIVGVLGILKAGGAYVPIDTTYPDTRLNLMIKDAGVQLLLTQERLAERCSEPLEKLICLDRDWPAVSRYSCEALEAQVSPDNAAYLIYTSGSTGRPKGVIVTHRSARNLFNAVDEKLHFSENDVWTMFHSASFDFSVWEIWGALIHGGTLVVVPFQVARAPEEFYRLACERGVTILSQTPSAFRNFIKADEEIGTGGNVSLRAVIFGGEALDFQSLRPWMDLHGDGLPQLINMYGITETTVHTTFKRVRSEDLERYSGSSIGRPLANMRMYALDERMQPAPVGATGELYVAGEGMARGYIGREELTAERFMPAPCGRPGERVYRTGDLARYLSDGNIEYRGRKDHQVKIRGYRIELGEIEAALNEHRGVRQSVMVAREDEKGWKRLVGYVVGEEEITSAELKRDLRERLPEYMTPETIILLSEMPLTANGKIDRNRLPSASALRDADRRLEPEDAEPRTPVEAIVGAIFEDVLRQDRIGIRDNFFEIGGHSLLATQVVSRVRDVFKIEIGVASIFETATVEGMARKIEGAMRDGESDEKQPPLVKLSREGLGSGRLPLSFAQQRLWFLAQLAPDNPFYNMPGSMRLEGRLDLDALERAINEIISRHEVLRTRFEVEDDQPVQVIDDWKPLKLEVEDLTTLPPQAREDAVKLRSREEAGTAFDLKRGPLLKVKILKLEEEQHALLFTMHHIVGDGWSVGVLIREAGELYQAYSAGEESPLAELPIQYADFAVWQRRYLAGEVLERKIGYWKERLKGAAVLELPTDYARPVAPSYRGGLERLEIGESLTEKLKRLSHREGATLFMALMAAFKVLLMRYSGEDDVIVGTVIANRTRRELEGLIGFFVNTVALRTDLSGNPSFRELIGREREVALGAYGSQGVPFEMLVEAINPERDLSRSPLFQVMMGLENSRREELEIRGLVVKGMSEETGTAKFDLTLDFTEEKEGLSGSIEYSLDLYERETVRRMARHYKQMLEEITGDAGRPIRQIELMSDAEKRQINEEWNATERGWEETRLAHELIAEQAAGNSEAIAVVAGEEHVSYRELNERANRLARYLRSLGVGPEVLVGVCLERSIEMVTAVLGVLKAGGAYAPLNPSYPEERLTFMLEETQAPVLLTQRLTQRPSMTWASASQIVYLDSDWQIIDRESAEDPGCAAAAVNSAYVIYTSGTTGKAKGVVVRHESLINAYWAWHEVYQLGSRATCHLQMASFSFDVCSGDLIRSLCSGGKLVLCPQELLLDPKGLYALMLREKIDCAEFIPIVLKNLVSYLEETGQSLEFMRALIAGSDLWRMSEYQKCLRYCGPETRLINSYGLTEATIDSSYFEKSALDLSVDRVAPIGRPFANTKIYLLDACLQPVPIGVYSEIHVGGLGLALGYHRNPELTAEKFIPDPFSHEKGARLYRSGDMARYLPDGIIELIGRCDNQIKVRGFRIEIGEVEAALGRHPAVREVAAMVREDLPGDKRLVAYYVPTPGTAPAGRELRQFLLEKLPGYLVPSSFVRVDRLPLTANGKIDRRALPALNSSQPESNEDYVAPITPVEELLAGIWAGVLGLDRVGRYDNFFEIGGHSLAATQVASRMRKTFGVEIEVRRIFEESTVAGLAQTMEKIIRSAGSKHEAPLVSVDRRADERACLVQLPLSFPQQRLWFLDQMEPGSASYNIPFALRMRGRLQVEALRRSLSEIVRRHEVLRTCFPAQGGKPSQKILPAEPVPLPVLDLRDLAEGQREATARRLVEEEARRSFDLFRGPLLRAVLLKLDEEDHVAIFTMHHIVSDGWSIEILFREIGALYRAYRAGLPSPLEELPIQYADFAIWQRERMQGETLEAELGYWRKRLAGIEDLELPADHPRQPLLSNRGARYQFVVEKDLAEALRGSSRQERATLFMTLMGGFNVLLNRYSGLEDIVIGTDIANRNRPEIEGLIGFFVNQLVLRVEVNAGASFRELLGQVREVCLGAYAHQDLPFEKLVEELQPERNLSRSPLFQVKLILQSAPREGLTLEGISAVILDGSDAQAARFDLIASITDEGHHLLGTFIYDRDLFESQTIERLANHYINVLREVVADSDNPIAELNMLSPSEREQIVVEWNQTALPYPENRAVHELFADQAKRTPDRIALSGGNLQMSYQELNRRANQLGSYLKGQGVGCETVVGVCMERSAGMVEALLGTLKAGGAYLPLDWEYPVERLSYMLEDAGVGVLLSESGPDSHLPPFWGRTIYLDVEDEKIREESERELENEASAENLAYVIYTSGSTGRPKGVMVAHRGICNLVEAQKAAFGIHEQSRVLQFASLSFDASVSEIFTALTSGGALQLRSKEEILPGEGLLRTLKEAGITTVTLPPTALAMMEEEELIELETIIAAGEACPKELVESWGRGRRFLDAYGPTEATVCASIGECEAGNETRPSIGRPIDNVRVYLLDREMQLTPLGARGEIYIAGAGLARGYLGRPDLTAERFLPDRFSAAGGERVYRAGDLCRYRLDGKLDFVGRVDDQVKLRGYRIELGEIQALLDEHRSVKQSVVVAEENEKGEKRIIAYATADEGTTAGELKKHVRESAPEYMVPEVIVLLDRMPVTANGKIDRKRLPSAENAGRQVVEEFIAARTPVEDLLAGFFQEALKLDRVGVNDNFFDLGGHSLVATQVVSRASDVFGVELGVRHIFEHATVERLARRIEEAIRAGGNSQAPPLVRTFRGEESPLSFAQQRLWFLDQLAPNNPLYNCSEAMRLEGKLDLSAFERAINEILRRHEILRTRFIVVGREPLQVIDEWKPRTFELEDLTSLSQGEREDVIARNAREEAETGFDLSQGPLLRVKILKLGEESHVVLFTMHHIVSDGWSMGVLVNELSALYEAMRKGLESPFPELAVQYADFAIWQREWLKGEALEAQLAYWRKQLADLEELELPVDYPRSAAPNYQGASRSFVIEKEVASKLRALGQRMGTTLFMTLLGGFKVLMSRYTGQQDIVIGTDIANRNRAGIEGLIGFFVNQLVLRVKVKAGESFSKLLKQVRDVCLGAYAHQDLPFEKLVETLQPERDLSRSPLFQAKLILQNDPREALRLDGLVLGGVGGDKAETANVDLRMSIIDVGRDLIGTLTYSRDLFETETIERLMGHYRNLLKGIVAETERPISALNLLSEAEREQIVVEWNETQRRYQDDWPIHRLFTRQAVRTPERIALIGDGGQVSYGELNRRASQLGNYLRRLGVGPEVVVGLCLERSVEMVVGLLGALNAGGAYLPLDPNNPLERLDYMLEGAGVGVVLTQRKLMERLPPFWGQTICLDEEWEKIGAESESEPEGAAEAENLAYVIYTSGSTGGPKGVMINHGGLSNYLKWAAEAYGIEEGEGAPVQSSIGFDLTVTSLYGPLVSGKSVRLLPEEEGVEALGNLLKREGGYSLLKITPAHLDVLAQQLGSSKAEGRAGALVIGGEELRTSGLKYWRERAPETRLLNEYGPTETVVGCCVYEVNGVEPRRESVPIGRPIANAKLYVLDRGLEPAPVGARGEIYISGAGLARGYVKSPELTGEKFLPNHFSRNGGERLYRTGDVGRYLPDGNLEFMGRVDEQVKVRGYRVELGEIEAALNKHASVKQSVVLARENERGEKRLIGYVVGEEGATAAELKKYLRERLPEYMTPETILTLAEMPLTANGKIDRRRLPSEKDAGLRSDPDDVGALTPVEEMVGGIFEEVLNLDRVGRKENFFEIGGHSLLATQLVSRVRDVFDVEIPVRTIFESATIEGLAGEIEDVMRAGDKSEAHPSIKALRQRIAPLSFAQQRLWFIHQLDPDNTAYNIPRAIRLEGQLDLAALEYSINEIIRRHEVLRTRFEAEDGEPAQVIDEWKYQKVEFVDLTTYPPGEREERAKGITDEEVGTRFDLSRGPLFRAKVLKLEENDHLAILTMHHIVSDGWSVGVMIREVGAFYRLYLEKGESAPEDLPIQYADYAVWQRAYLTGAVLEREVEYWKRRLAGAALLALPTDYPRPETPSNRGSGERVRVRKDLYESLRSLGQRDGATLFMILMAAFKILLMRYSSEEDVVVGTAIANRTRREVEGLVGFFVNTLVLRTNLGGNPTFRELIRRERETALEAYAHQEAPFEKLVGEINPERDISRGPLFQVMMALENTKREKLEIPGLKVGMGEAESGASKFDLTLMLTQEDDVIEGSLDYSLDLYEAETIRRMARHYERVLEGAIKDADQRISEIELMSPAESEQVLKKWNETSVKYEIEQSIAELFEEQAELRPDRVAIVSEEQELSYGEVNRRANQLAHHLRRFGVGPEALVGVCMERRPELIIGLLGVLKAGGAYLPLDPDSPTERLRFILEDGDPLALLTQERFLAKLSSFRGKSFCLDRDWASAANESEEKLRREIESDNMLYLYYTSGSTGRPKGVIGLHGAAINRFAWMWRTYPFTAEDVACQKTTLSFVDSVWEIFGPLLQGVRSILIERETLIDGERLARVLERERISRIVLVPSLLRSLVESISNLPGYRCELKHCTSSGETLPRELAEAFLQQAPQSALLNVYGATEVAADSSYHQITCSDLKSSVSFGRPIANTEIFLLDPYFHPAPVGGRGEIYIGGDGLGRGYQNQAAMTAEKFIPNPFNGATGERLYKTGDLGLYRTDGAIKYLGRIDHQVKIRGNRIELREIEAHLSAHPGVRQCVALALPDNFGEMRLAVYLVPERVSPPSLSVLRSYLEERLPGYMLPSWFIWMEQIPLSPNGKLDKLALPRPDESSIASEREYETPTGPLEQTLAGIWSEILGIEEISINDNFFELGGHSLLLTRVVSRIRAACAIDLPLRTLFEFPTIKQLGVAITAQKLMETDSKDVSELLMQMLNLPSEEIRAMLSSE